MEDFRKYFLDVYSHSLSTNVAVQFINTAGSLKCLFFRYFYLVYLFILSWFFFVTKFHNSFFHRFTFWIECLDWISEYIAFYYFKNTVEDIFKITMMVPFCKVPLYLKYSKTPLIFQSATSLMFPILTIKIYSLLL